MNFVATMFAWQPVCLATRAVHALHSDQNSWCAFDPSPIMGWIKVNKDQILTITFIKLSISDSQRHPKNVCVCPPSPHHHPYLYIHGIGPREVRALPVWRCRQAAWQT